MCGIVGYISKNKNAIEVLINGLKSLEYRGYDSSGIAYIKDNKIIIKKEKGKVSELEKDINISEESNIGIAHTRWATHGIPDKINAHPHSCEKITLVHNGIIENYEELKEKLKDIYEIKSQTDTEIIAILLNDIYKEKNNIIDSIIELKKILKGSYALAILCEDYKDKIFALRKDSPLIIAKNDDSSFLASDVPAILKYTNKYILLEQDEIAILEKDKINIINDNKELQNKEIKIFEGDINSAEKNGYSHFMLKEIYEEKDAIKRIMNENNTFEKFLNNYKFLKNYNKISIIACGSSYHVGMISKYLIEENANIEVNVEVASEFRYKKNFLDKNSLAIFISQSGETADTLASLRMVKEKNIPTLAIVNVVGSSIAREADTTIYTNSGPEIAVATTKALISQLVITTLITLYLGCINNNITKDEVISSLNELNSLDNEIETILKMDYKEIAKGLYTKNSLFFIGRNIDYAIALEGSLKLKEISYIHSEAYPSGELKHGTISLIEENTPVICILTKDEIIDKTISNIKEVKARGAHIIGITTKNYDFIDQKIILSKKSKFIVPIIAIIPLQLIAFETAKLKNCDIDKPRNLAKSVTVE